MTARQGTQVKQVCNRKGITWWEPRGQIWRVQRIAVERGTHSRSEESQLERGCKRWHPKLPEENMGRKSPLSEYMSLHPSLTHHRNINSFENKVWEIYFYKEVCSFVHWSLSIMFDYVSAYIVFRLYNNMKVTECPKVVLMFIFNIFH